MVARAVAAYGGAVKEHQEEMLMLRKLALAAATAVLTTTAAYAQKADFGTASEAKAMLEKAAAAVKADKAKALKSFNEGAEGFKDRDLYPFCANASDGIFTAHPKLVGKSLKDLEDKAGKKFGAEIMSTAKEGQVSEVDYMWPRPGKDDPVQKVTFVTKAGDQVCAVGYYK
jgi:signal transduction histidine kinase